MFLLRPFKGEAILTEDDEKKEIIVKAPSKSIIAPEKKSEKVTEKALEEERYNVLQISTKVGRYVGLSSTAAGALLISLLIYAHLADQDNLILLSVDSSLPIVGLWIAVGLISVIVGFLLMGSE